MFSSKTAIAQAFSNDIDFEGEQKDSWTEKEIIQKMKTISKERKFEESVELTLKLNVDPAQGDQNIRGTCILPAGTGNEVKVCVFTDEELHENAKAAGADVIGDENLLKEISQGAKIEFDKIICT